LAQRELERRIAELRSSEPWTEDEARLVLDAWEESGESVAAFARRMGLWGLPPVLVAQALGAGGARARGIRAAGCA
jgi:hypothetical protein